MNIHGPAGGKADLLVVTDSGLLLEVGAFLTLFEVY
jgi:hypothetical protein